MDSHVFHKTDFYGIGRSGSDPREMDEEGVDGGGWIEGSGDARNAREEIKRER